MLFKLLVILAPPLPFSHTPQCTHVYLCRSSNELCCSCPAIWIWIFLIILYPLSFVIINPAFLCTRIQTKGQWHVCLPWDNLDIG